MDELAKYKGDIMISINDILKECEIANKIHTAAIILLVIIIAVQVAVTILFFIKAKNMKEKNRLPKLMMVVGCADGV